MRGRFTDSIASTDGWSYAPGAEVALAGEGFCEDAIPERVGRQWLASGLLEPVAALIESAVAPRSESTAIPAISARPHVGRPSPRR